MKSFEISHATFEDSDGIPALIKSTSVCFGYVDSNGIIYENLIGVSISKIMS